jgi:hypothetical protein
LSSPGPVLRGGVQRHLDPLIMVVMCWGTVIGNGKHVHIVRMHHNLILEVENYPTV